MPQFIKIEPDKNKKLLISVSEEFINRHKNLLSEVEEDDQGNKIYTMWRSSINSISFPSFHLIVYDIVEEITDSASNKTSFCFTTKE